MTITSFFGYPVSKDGPKSPSTLDEILQVLELIKPRPSSRPLMRIGGNRDGSYLIPDDLQGITACFSPGVNNFKYFEDYLVDNYGIDCHMCDYSSDINKFSTPLKEGKQTFLKKWLDNKPGDDNISLDDWVRSCSPGGDLLLQIDIEGAEWRNLLSVSDETLNRFRIIVIEIHELKHLAHSEVLRSVIAPLFQRLSKTFTVVHAHPNNCCGEFVFPRGGGDSIRIPNVLELTYLRTDRLDDPKYPPLLPHPLDVGRNIATKPPMFLGEEWLEGDRPPESKNKMREDQLEYEAFLAERLAQRNNRIDIPAGVGGLLQRSLKTLDKKTEALRKQTPAGDGALLDVAVGRPYTLSTANAATKVTGVVQEASPFFFHTGFGKNEFIKVDLGSARTVARIAIRNRLDTCFDRAHVMFAILSPDENIDKGEVFHVNATDDFLSGETLELDISFPPTQARFVTLISPVETALHFSALKIFAS